MKKMSDNPSLIDPEIRKEDKYWLKREIRRRKKENDKKRIFNQNRREKRKYNY